MTPRIVAYIGVCSTGLLFHPALPQEPEQPGGTVELGDGRQIPRSVVLNAGLERWLKVASDKYKIRWREAPAVFEECQREENLRQERKLSRVTSEKINFLRLSLKRWIAAGVEMCWAQAGGGTGFGPKKVYYDAKTEEEIRHVLPEIHDRTTSSRERSRASRVIKRVHHWLPHLSKPSRYQKALHLSSFLEFRRETRRLGGGLRFLPDRAAGQFATFIQEVLKYVLAEHGLMKRQPER